LFLLMLRDRVQATRNKCKGCLFVGWWSSIASDLHTQRFAFPLLKLTMLRDSASFQQFEICLCPVGPLSLSPDRNHHEMFIEASGRRDLHNNPECAGHQATLAFSLEFETLRARTALTDTSALRNQKLHHILFKHPARLH
jgi:hypothetical protein